MSDYRRRFIPGAMYFLTLVTYGRRRILTTEPGRRILRSAIQKVQGDWAFSLFATVLLPDHWHLVMQLPDRDVNYPTRIKRIKEEFTKHWLEEEREEHSVTESQLSRGERGVWQLRYWEHTIEDADDLERCVDYIHWNPRKHGLVERVRDYPWSSFQRFVAAGQYEIGWGSAKPDSVSLDRDWGEP